MFIPEKHSFGKKNQIYVLKNNQSEERIDISPILIHTPQDMHPGLKQNYMWMATG
jgi:hypothetical protein